MSTITGPRSLSLFFLDRDTKTMREAIDQLPPKEDAMSAQDLQARATFLVRRCAEGVKHIEELLANSFAAAAQGSVDDYNAFGNQILSMAKGSLKNLEDICAFTHEVNRTTAATVDADSMDSLVARTRTLIADFEANWPWIDFTRLEESIADEEQGKPRQAAKEVFDELRRRLRAKSQH
jgi:ribosomal 50S subunit-associated protein YjgA (DUF615 family)